MVKGVSRQVIVVHSPDPKLFEQAIFILKDGQQEVQVEFFLGHHACTSLERVAFSCTSAMETTAMAKITAFA